MVNFFTNLKVGTKILVICLVLAILPSLSIGIVAYTSSSNVISEETETLLQTQVHDMKGWTNDVYTLTINKVNSDLNVLRQNFYRKGTPAIIGENMVLTNPNGETYVVNDDFEVVDLVRNLVGGTATIFQVYDDTYAVRVSTNVKEQDGTRAVGTRLKEEVFDVTVREGETYYGKRDLFGIDYVTAYEPIKNEEGKVIGILYVGTEEQETLDVVKQSIRNTKIGKNGFMYVVDSTGTILVHPTREGENIADKRFFQEMASTGGSGIVSEGDQENIIDAYTYYEPLDWYIISRADLSEFTGPIDTIRNSIVIVVAIFIIIGVVIAFLFGKTMSEPV